jgi:MFS family permease
VFRARLRQTREEPPPSIKRMGRYRRLLMNRPFARLWTGSTISSFGDSLTWVALVWLVYSRSGSPREVSELIVVATAPVFIGGVLMGAALDRFERRRFLALVNTVLGAAVLSVPLVAAVGTVTSVHLFAVAALYGFLKMANWAGVPSIVPGLVSDPDDLTTANAMESVSFGLADIAGPAAAGALIAVMGATSVLGIDAASYLIFVIVLLSLPGQAVPIRDPTERGLGLRPALRFLRNDRAVFATTVMFMSANIGEGMTIVLIPVYAREVLGGGAGTYGVLLSAFALAATAGAALVGAMTWRRSLGRSIAVSQVLFGLGYLPLVALPGLAPAVGALALAGALGSPLTIWAQTLRMQRIPSEMRGRVFGLLRTLMQSTPPIGGALAGLLIPAIGLRWTFGLVVVAIGVPGVIGLALPSLKTADVREPSASS